MSGKWSLYIPSRFWQVFFWEFIQNLPVVAGFMVAIHLWPQGRAGAAVACLLAGSIVGSLAIRLTESRIVEGHHEPWRVVITNIVVITALMLVFTIYLAASWSRWWTDALIGLVGGSGLRAAQNLASGSPLNPGRCGLFGLSCALGFVGVRLSSANLPIWLAVLIVTAVVTGAIVLTDYGPWDAEGVCQSAVR